MNTKVKFGIIAVLLILLAGGFAMYNASIQEDFANISRTETYRIGDHFTGQYHRPSCPKLKQTYGDGIRFESIEEARKEGYSACKRCDPDGPNE